MRKFTIFFTILLAITIKTNAQWVQMSNGIGNDHLIMSLASSGNYIYAGVAIALGDTSAIDGVYVSTNNGESWIEPNYDTGCYLEPWGLAANGNYVYAATSYFVWVSSDNGSNWWQPNGSHSEAVGTVTICGNYVFSGGGLGVWRSDNNGTDWNYIPSNTDSNYITGHAASGNLVFAVTSTPNWNSGKVLMTDDYGYSWTTKLTITSDYFESIDVNGNNICAKAHWGGIYLSTDFGNTWTNQQMINGLNIMSVAMSGNNIFAHTGAMLYLSTDIGQAWTEINEGFPDTAPDVRSLVIANGYVFLGTTFSSIWRRSLDEITGIDRNTQNNNVSIYPNPVSNIFTLNIDKKNNNEKLVLNIYSAIGVLVRSELLKDNQQKINIGDLRNGIYLVEIKSNKWTEKQKLIIRR